MGNVGDVIDGNEEVDDTVFTEVVDCNVEDFVEAVD